MNKAQLINVLAEATGTTKVAAGEYLERLGTIISTELAQGGEVTLPGLGKLATVQRAARKGRNPRTGAAVDVAAKKAVKFTPLKVLKKTLNP